MVYKYVTEIEPASLTHRLYAIEVPGDSEPGSIRWNRDDANSSSLHKGEKTMCETCGCQGTVSTVASGSSASQTPPISSVSEMSSPPQPLAERVSDSLQHAIHVVVGSQRMPPRRIRSLLN